MALQPGTSGGLFGRVAQMEAELATLRATVAQLTDMVAQLTLAMNGPTAAGAPSPELADLTAGLQRIALAFAEANRLTLADLCGPGRWVPLTHVRQDCMLAMREAGFSTLAVGRFLGGRDHTTVLSGVAAARRRREGKKMESQGKAA